MTLASTIPEATIMLRKIGIAAFVCLLLISSLGSAETGPPFSVDLSIKNRAVISETKTIKVTQGQDVEINWTTDEKVLLHLHGYNVSVTVKPGERVSMKFNAANSGRFPIMPHNFKHQALIYLEVYPE
jgi:hypothetical protein